MPVEEAEAGFVWTAEDVRLDLEETGLPEARAARLALAVCSAALASCATQRVSIDDDDIGGVVTGPDGPEAGVWVIAETADLPTPFVRIVVTDDAGRYVLRVSASVPMSRASSPSRRRAGGTPPVRSRSDSSSGASELVVSAYGTRCAICRLRHAELLDAWHTLSDRDERGRPEVPNGLSLCKLQHAACDNDVLGVDPPPTWSTCVALSDSQPSRDFSRDSRKRRGSGRALRAASQRPEREYLEGRFARFPAARAGSSPLRRAPPARARRLVSLALPHDAMRPG